jgi:hypothetical protein
VLEAAPSDIPVEVPIVAPLPAPLPAPLQSEEITENRAPESTRDEHESAGESELEVPSTSRGKNEIALPESGLPEKNEIVVPDSSGSEEIEIPDPSTPNREEIILPDSELSSGDELTVGDDNLNLWLLAAFGLLVVGIERLKYRRPRYALQ